MRKLTQQTTHMGNTSLLLYIATSVVQVQASNYLWCVCCSYGLSILQYGGTAVGRVPGVKTNQSINQSINQYSVASITG